MGILEAKENVLQGVIDNCFAEKENMCFCLFTQGILSFLVIDCLLFDLWVILKCLYN